MSAIDSLTLKTSRPRGVVATGLAACLLIALPLAAQDPASSDPGPTQRVRALRVLDCDPGEDCPKLITLDSRGGFLGVEPTSLNPALRQHFGAPAEAGVLIAEVREGSPAAAAGIAVGDVLVAVNGEPVRSTGHLGRLIRPLEDGSAVDIEVVRDHRSLVLHAVITQRARTTIDLADLVDRSVHDSLQSLDLDALHESLEALDLDSLGAIDLDGLEFNEMALGTALEAVGEVFNSENWKTYVEQIDRIDFDRFEERMKELQERMERLERELEHERGNEPSS